MNRIKNLIPSNRDQIQFLLLSFGGTILLFYSLILTFAPIIRTVSWDTPIKWEQWVALVIWMLVGLFAHRTSLKKLPNRDPYLIPIIYSLIGIGLMTIFRLSTTFGWRQLIWFVLGSLFFVFGFEYKSILPILRRYKYVWLSLGLFATILTLFIGIYPGGEGPQLWLGCCGIYIQPSEPLKLLFIVFLSAFFADNWALKKNFSVILMPSLIMVAAASIVLFSQRDLGTAIIFLTIYALYLFIVSGKRRTLLIFLLLVLITGLIGYQYIELIKIRIDGWLNPWIDSSGGSYQIIQSLQAIASGRFLGTGPGLGSPGLVPVALSDFIFAAINEELGLIGGVFVICLYFIFAYRGFMISIKSQNQFYKLLSFGITVFISIQAILILGGNVRLLPLTGVTLPFVSYGGSSLITVFIAGLILLLISNHQSAKSIEEKEYKPIFLTYYLILAGFSSLILLTSFWSIISVDRLINRPDNLRRVINDRYVPRGEILDRKNFSILTTTGLRGEFTRWLNEPSLSTMVGYNLPILGQSGLEAYFDSYLRGMAGLPTMDIFLNQLVYGRPPDGLDIRTTIDLQKQQYLTEMLSERKGGAVLMNAQNGEILAMWSSPSFDANNLKSDFESLLTDENAPLINRVTQGSYYLGNLSSIFSLAYLSEKSIVIDQDGFSENDKCAYPIPNSKKTNFPLAVRYGCETANRLLTNSLNSNSSTEIILKYGWNEVFDFELPISQLTIPEEETDDPLSSLQISPLQIARASSAFSNGGLIPYPKLGLAVNSPKEGWIIFPSKEPIRSINRLTANQTATLLSRENFPVWEITSSNFSNENPLHWYVSGTLPNWQASPMVLVIAFEDGTSEEAKTLGQEIMEKILTNSN